MCNPIQFTVNENSYEFCDVFDSIYMKHHIMCFINMNG